MLKGSSIKKQAIRGSLWTTGGYGASQALRFTNNIILSRLLAPESFGLMVLINTFIMGVELFSDIGIGQSLIQNPKGEEQSFYDTAWSLQVFRGFCLFAVCLLLTLPVSRFYDDSKLLYLFPTASLGVVINGCASTSIFLLRKRVELAKLTFLELFKQAISTSSMIVWAMISPGVMALVMGSLIGATCKTVASHFLIPNFRNRLTFNNEVVGEIVGFGRWIFASTILIFLSRQSDRLILGRLFSLELLGIYGIARALSNAVRLVILRLSGGVIFPVASKLAGLPRSQLRKKIKPYRMKALLVSTVAYSVLFGFSPFIISFLFDERYQDAAWMMPVVIVGLWISTLYQTTEPILMGLGKPQYGAIANGVKTSSLFVGMIIGGMSGSFFGAILAVPVSELLAYLSVLIGFSREKLLFLKQDFIIGIVFVLSGALFTWIQSLL